MGVALRRILKRILGGILHNPGSNPWKYPQKNPGGNPWKNPGGNPWKNPGSHPGSNPWKYPGSNPWKYPGSHPGSNPWKYPGSHPWKYPGSNPWKNPGGNPWKYPGKSYPTFQWTRLKTCIFFSMLTPRTNVAGAHQQNLHVKAGSRLSGNQSYYWLLPLALALVFSFFKLPTLPLSTLLIAAALAALVFMSASTPWLQFAYNCFIKPFLVSKPSGVDSDEHQKRLEIFYQGQAQVYDVTRRRLLRGRSTMLKLCAAQLRQFYPCHFANNFKVGKKGQSVNDPANLPSPPLSPSFLQREDKRFAWVDVGGGTGENIERMNQFFPIANFDHVYLVDITPSLCEIARERFKKLGWSNVSVLCMDASKFEIPPEHGPDLDIALITMSYSLTMIESFYPIIDRLTSVLSPSGIFGVADFYVSSKRSADVTRQLNWVSRWFWAIWFDQDNVYLTPGRREYLEHKFKTVKTVSSKNNMLPFVYIPYYVWIGAQKESNLSVPVLNLNDTDSNKSDDEDQVKSVETLHVSSDHVHGQGVRWRQPFDPKLLSRFSTYIYAFAWEDPRVDLQYLNLKPSDHMFVITSGGCNVLEYAIKVGPQRIHSVDLNPCQNHMLELKLAAYSALEYEDFWKLFGDGHIPDFSSILDTQLSPHLSPYAYHFWKQNANFKNLFKTGCSGLAIRVFQFVIRAKRLESVIERFCSCETIEEQVKIWRAEVRPHLLSKWLIRILNNDRFLWGALGVPPAQMQMLLEEGFCKLTKVVRKSTW